MNDAGCFEPGVPAASTSSAVAALRAGAGPDGRRRPRRLRARSTPPSPQFSYSFHPFPGGTVREPDRDRSSTSARRLASTLTRAPPNQAAAQTFIDFVARPKQNALYAQMLGGLTQYEFLKQAAPELHVLASRRCSPTTHTSSTRPTWWNANVVLALQQDAIGLVTGQTTVDEVLKRWTPPGSRVRPSHARALRFARHRDLDRRLRELDRLGVVAGVRRDPRPGGASFEGVTVAGRGGERSTSCP